MTYPAEVNSILEQLPNTIFGTNCLRQLPEVIESLRAKHVLIVADRSALEATKSSSFFMKALRGLAFEFHIDSVTNVTDADIHRVLDVYEAFQPDTTIAFGGGATIDQAKLMCCLNKKNESGDTSDFDRSYEIVKNSRMIAIPTTSGSGSEATHFAVVYINGIKHSIANSLLLPEVALIDPSLTQSLPAKITAASGLDAFAQAMESLWSINATEFSISCSVASLRLSNQSLECATRNPTSESREHMALAAHLAGQAINISKTTACHAFSYPITQHFQVPHGAAVAITLSRMLAFNAGVKSDDCCDPRGPEAVAGRIALILKALDVDSISKACQRIDELIASVGYANDYELFGISTFDAFDIISREANVERLRNNPRRIFEEDLRKIITNPALIAIE